MPITRKDSILKQYYEANGQQSMFGYDNLEFKTINHPTAHSFVHLCNEFKLKMTKKSLIVSIPVTEITHLEPLGTITAHSTASDRHLSYISLK